MRRIGTILVISSLRVVCVSVRAESSADHIYSPHDASVPIPARFLDPTCPHLDLAIITVSSANASEDKLHQTNESEACGLRFSLADGSNEWINAKVFDPPVRVFVGTRNWLECGCKSLDETPHLLDE
jgi:hypothetical protein